MRSSLALAAIVMFALAPFAWAEDAPGLALAKSIVEDLRGDEHREKMRIVWPETVEATPPEGAEVIVITGYFDNTLTRMVWHEGKVEAQSVFAAQRWYGNRVGDSYAGAAFDVEPARFAVAWAAARFVIGARDERIEPPPAEHAHSEPRSLGGSHESQKWIRMRRTHSGVSLHCSNRLGWYVGGGSLWDAIRDHAVFQVFEPLLPERPSAAATAAMPLVRFLEDEIRRAAGRLDLDFRGEHRLLLDVALRVVGEFGDRDALDAVQGLEVALAHEDQSEYTVSKLSAMAAVAATKLRLAHDWNSTEAAAVIRKHAGGDLATWARRQCRARDPDGYLTLLLQDLARPEALTSDLVFTLAELRSVEAPNSLDSLRRWLDHASPMIRVAAAFALLKVDATSQAAAAALLAVADDCAIPEGLRCPENTEVFRVRALAVSEAVRANLLDSKALRTRLAQPNSMHALVVRALLDGLSASADPPSTDDVLDAWRRVAGGPVELGVTTGIGTLLDLRDLHSRGRIAAALDRLAQSLNDDGWNWTTPYEVGHLRERLELEMPMPAAPK